MKNNGIKIFIIIIVLIILISGSVLAYKMYKDKENQEVSNEQNVESAINITEPTEQEENVQEETNNKTINIYNGNQRPIAVMIDNHTKAWPQGGLNQAYLVYEIIVEGGETRLMALFKGVNVDKIGPVRSSRHYFLDYALENDAIYVHYGWSPQAENDISKLNVNNINGITSSSTSFWRVSDKSAPHNVATSTEKIMEIAKSKGYSTTSSATSVLNYVSEENLFNEGTTANKVTIPHSNLQTVRYEYDEQTKEYKRYARNKAQTDWSSKQAITTKNIIVEFINNVDLNDGENKGRQDLKNIGTYDGYYITDGKAIKIKCTKNSRKNKTIYKDLNGNEINVNDGRTFINICPTDAKVTFE